MKTLLIGVLMLLPLPAMAQERPQTLPTRDVDITYRITRAGQTLEERTRWLAALQLQRIDPPGSAMYMLMDHRTNHASMINDPAKTVLDLSASAGPGPLDPGGHADFARKDGDMVAGLACTNWQTTSGGTDTVLCITTDGALLRVQAGGHTLVEATAVSYTAADPTAFAVPPGYQHLSPKAP